MEIKPQRIEDLSPEKKKTIMERSMEDIASIYEDYLKFNELLDEGKEEELKNIVDEYKKEGKFPENTETPTKKLEILDILGVERYCCRRMMLTHVDLIDEVVPYS